MNDEITQYVDDIINIFKTNDTEKNNKIWNNIDNINILISNNWNHLNKYQKEQMKNKIQSQIMSLIYPIWITDEITQQNLFFYNKTLYVSTIITPSFLEITLPTDRFYLIENAIVELHNLDVHYFESPLKLLCYIYECFNSITVALKTPEHPDIEIDILIATLVYVIIQTKPKNFIAISRWIDEMTNPTDSRTGELYYIYTHFVVAISYIYDFHYSVLDSVKTYLYSLPFYSLNDTIAFVPKFLFQSWNLFRSKV